MSLSIILFLVAFVILAVLFPNNRHRPVIYREHRRPNRREALRGIATVLALLAILLLPALLIGATR